MMSKLKKALHLKFSHLLFFYAGAFTFIQLDIWYWTPKEGITPAAFTASASTITLLLALIALAKVNKWLDDKIKDKRFEKAHYFFEKMAELYVSMSRLNSAIINIPTERGLVKTSLFVEGLQEIKDIRKQAVALMIDVAATEKHFSAMGIKFHHSKSLGKYLTHCVHISKQAYTMSTFLENREFPDVGKIDEKFQLKFDKIVEDCRQDINVRYDTCNYIGEGFLKLKFESMFELVKK